MRLYTHTHTHTHGYSIKDKKGITLIALVITIIVLLILAGVSINMISGDDGIATQASNASEKTRGGKIKEQVGLILEENKIANYQGDDLMTKEEVIEKLVEQDLLTEEEVAKLDNQDEITVGGITIDFSELEDDGFDYFNKKYLLRNSSGIYCVFNENSGVIAYDKDDNVVSNIPASNVSYMEDKIIISNADYLSGTYDFQKEKHYVYATLEDGYEYCFAVEDGYCTHVRHGNEDTIDYDLSDIENPYVGCDTCGESFDTRYINGVLYVHNVYLGINDYIADSWYDSTFGGYLAVIWDKTLENIKVESQIDGIDVVQCIGFQGEDDHVIAAAKTLSLPSTLKYVESNGFGWNDSLEEIIYDGTMEEWNEIQASGCVLENVYNKVICTDGEIEY